LEIPYTVPVFTCWSCAKVAATVGYSRHNEEEEEEDWDKEKCDNGYRSVLTIFEAQLTGHRHYLAAFRILASNR